MSPPTIRLTRPVSLAIPSPCHGDVVRVPRVTESADQARLAFDEAPAVGRPPMCCAFESVVRIVPALRTVEDVVAHLVGHWPELRDRKLLGDGLYVREAKAATVATFSSAAALDVIPGTTDVYVLPRDPALPAFVIATTHGLEFDWDALELGVAKPSEPAPPRGWLAWLRARGGR